MTQSRLTIALNSGDIVLPETGRIAVFGPSIGTDLSALPQDRCQVIQPLKPDFDGFSAAGFDCAIAAEGAYAASVVFLPRAKQLARDLVATAVAVSSDLVIVDGQKTDGIESVMKECKKRSSLMGAFSKAHGKSFWMAASGDFTDWQAAEQSTATGGFTTAPGVFSADAIDPASQLLIDSLPHKLGRTVADLGAGWGFLSSCLLQRDAIEALHLVEADHVALACARQNVSDPRAEFHWADATAWKPAGRVDTVVMNPPFHTGRSTDPDLGRAFIAAAAAMLAPSGHLWMVANRHLAYETALQGLFVKVEEISGNNRFKILHAQRPTRKRG